MLESRRHGTVCYLLFRRRDDFDGEVWWSLLIDVWNPHRQKIGEKIAASGMRIRSGSWFWRRNRRESVCED